MTVYYVLFGLTHNSFLNKENELDKSWRLAKRFESKKEAIAWLSTYKSLIIEKTKEEYWTTREFFVISK